MQKKDCSGAEDGCYYLLIRYHAGLQQTYVKSLACHKDHLVGLTDQVTVVENVNDNLQHNKKFQRDHVREVAPLPPNPVGFLLMKFSCKSEAERWVSCKQQNWLGRDTDIIGFLSAKHLDLYKTPYMQVVDFCPSDKERISKEYFPPLAKLMQGKPKDIVNPGAVVTDKHDCYRGRWQLKTLIITLFANGEDCVNFFKSDGYRPIKAVRHQAAQTNVVLFKPEPLSKFAMPDTVQKSKTSTKGGCFYLLIRYPDTLHQRCKNSIIVHMSHHKENIVGLTNEVTCVENIDDYLQYNKKYKMDGIREVASLPSPRVGFLLMKFSCQSKAERWLISTPDIKQPDWLDREADIIGFASDKPLNLRQTPCLQVVDISISDPKRIVNEYFPQLTVLLSDMEKHKIDPVVVNTDKTVHYRGKWHIKSLVITLYANAEDCKNFFKSDGYRPVKAVRQQAAQTNVVVFKPEPLFK